MLSFFNIYSIALFEIKNQLRSWFFRIFSILTLFIIVLINIGIFGTERSPMSFRALPSFIPYLNILILNIAQAVIVGFMASDFMKYDRKLDSTDVVYMRSMTNVDYVLGKTAGVLAIFFGLNLAALVNALIFNVFIADMPFVTQVYLLYPLLISIPTLVFMIGLSFLLMSILRSQALTFIILLGYIAITLFFLGTRFHQLFDYMAFYLPLAWSDFSGFSDIGLIFIQRGIYTLFGIGFIFTSVLMLKRLPQSRPMSAVSVVISTISIITAFVLGGIYLNNITVGRNIREAIADLNKRETDTPSVTVTSSRLDLNHKGNTIDVSAALTFTNDTSAPIERYVFSLNPGLEITSVSGGGRDLSFERTLHIVDITPAVPLSPGSQDSLVIKYSGAIDENACYPDIDEDMRDDQFRLMLYNIGKRYAFIGPDYVLLTQEALWYPVAGIPYGSAYPYLGKKNFVNYTLTVTTDKALTAVSQGAVQTPKEGTFVFNPETPLSRLSLAIGPYKKMSIEAGGIEYAVYIHEGHDYFSELFTDVTDEIPKVIEDIKLRYEDKLGLEYPYKRFSIVETPAQFFTYPRMWSVAQETAQPEQILLPEKGCVLMNADFGQRLYWMQRQVERGNRAMTPEEIQSNLFRDFVNSTFVEQRFNFMSMRQGMRMRVGQNISLPRLFLGGVPKHYGTYTIFPLYYTYSNHFTSERWPIFTTALELYLDERTSSNMPSFFRMVRGLSDEELANLALAGKSLMTVLTEPRDISEVKNILKLESSYLFSRIMTETGVEPFTEYINSTLAERRFETYDVQTFADDIGEKFDVEIEPIIDDVLNKKQQPAFVFSEPSLSEIVEGRQTQYHVSLTVTNIETVDGLITITLRYRDESMGGGRGGGGPGFFGRQDSGSETERYYNIPANTTKEIGLILDERPGSITINTMVSQNIPSVIDKRISRLEREPVSNPFEGERIVKTPVVESQPGEVIVDNEDPGFDTESNVKESFARRLLNNTDSEENEYIGLTFWNMPKRWQATTDNSYYGLYRLSAFYIRPGSGQNIAMWNAEIPRSGKYNVYYHIAQIRAPFMRRGRGGGEREEVVKDFHFSIHHDDGVDDVELDAGGAEEGWVLLGTYYFSEGRAKVELSDETDGRMVYADAVRWVIQE